MRSSRRTDRRRDRAQGRARRAGLSRSPRLGGRTSRSIINAPGAAGVPVETGPLAHFRRVARRRPAAVQRGAFARSPASVPESHSSSRASTICAARWSPPDSSPLPSARRPRSKPQHSRPCGSISSPRRCDDRRRAWLRDGRRRARRGQLQNRNFFIPRATDRARVAGTRSMSPRSSSAATLSSAAISVLNLGRRPSRQP